MLKRRAVWNRRSSRWPKEISFQRPLEDRLADGADGRLELVDPGAGSGTQPDSTCSSATRLVVAVEEGEEVLRQVALVLWQGADDAEVHRDVAPGSGIDEDVARVHVGVEEVVRNTWVKKISTPRSASCFMVDAAPCRASMSPTGNAVDALHHHHVAGGCSPSTPRGRRACG
jgi:hypothetical protein